MSLLNLATSALETQDRFHYERSLYKHGFSVVAGSDEVGRGPLAGPVVAASVVLPRKCDRSPFLDSKQLSHSQRIKVFQYLKTLSCSIGIGIVSPTTIDQINILQASLLAMKRSIEDLDQQGCTVDYILVDGKFEIPVSLPQQALIKGESRSSSIAAASIVAKITRDQIMADLHERYPQYNFARHKGYPTKAHRLAIKEHGPCEIHRTTFRGVKEFVKKTT